MSESDTPETPPPESSSAPPPPPAPPSAPPPSPTHATVRGPVRNTLESIGMAVMMAVLLKYFVLEAYVIPTPSMQPTMMGSPAEGESDRILVDKFYYLLHEPKRWDIAVFRYPVRQVQSYVKRIVGVGGDRIKIAGGNLYQVEEGTGKLSVLRKPERIQRTLWREIYPKRRLLRLLETGEDLDTPPSDDDDYLNCRSGEWKVEDGAFVGTPRRDSLEIWFKTNLSCNLYSDGYDIDVANTTKKNRRAAGRTDIGDEAVQDLAIEFELTPENTPDRVTISLQIESEPSTRTFKVDIEGGKARLSASTKGVEPLSAEFPFEIAAGATTPIRFARLDDQLYLYRDGSEVGRLEVDVDGFRILTDLEVKKVHPKVIVKGKGTSRFANVRVERDLHYTRSYLPEDTIIEVPEGHFYMMGDNTLGSADGRDWTAMEIGIDENDNIVNPATHPNARKLWGNLRPKAFDSPDDPHDDDNPVPMLHRNRVVFVDEMGEYHSLFAKFDTKSWGTMYDENKTAQIQFLGPGDEPWICKTRPARFVPRKHIQGRPIARFLRALTSFKTVGWIR